MLSESAPYELESQESWHVHFDIVLARGVRP
jgi:hypothetical protein